MYIYIYIVGWEPTYKCGASFYMFRWDTSVRQATGNLFSVATEPTDSEWETSDGLPLDVWSIRSFLPSLHGRCSVIYKWISDHGMPYEIPQLDSWAGIILHKMATGPCDLTCCDQFEYFYHGIIRRCFRPWTCTNV